MEAPADLVWHAVISDGWLADEVVLELQPGGDAYVPLWRRHEDRLGRGCAGRRAARVLVGQRRRARHPGRADADGGGRADATPGRRDTSARRGSTSSAPHFPESPARRSVRRWWRPDHARPSPIQPGPCSAPSPIRPGGRCSSAIADQPSGHGDRARLRAPDLPPGGAQAPECADRRRPARPRAVRTRGPLPGHAGAAVRRGVVDGRGRRAVGRAACGAQAAARLSRRYKAPPDSGPRGRARRLARAQRG